MFRPSSQIVTCSKTSTQAVFEPSSDQDIPPHSCPPSAVFKRVQRQSFVRFFLLTRNRVRHRTYSFLRAHNMWCTFVGVPLTAVRHRVVSERCPLRLHSRVVHNRRVKLTPTCLAADANAPEEEEVLDEAAMRAAEIHEVLSGLQDFKSRIVDGTVNVCETLCRRETVALSHTETGN